MLRFFKWEVWGRARVMTLSVSLLLVLVLLPLRSERGVGTWEDALRSEGVQELGKIHWLYGQEPGQWTPAVAEVIPHGASAKDVFVFEGMLDGQGGPHRVRRVGNLTRTSDADDAILAMDSTAGRQLVATSSTLDGLVTSVSLLDLRGDPLTFRDEFGKRRRWGDGFKLAATNFQESGRISGISRRSYALEAPARKISARFDGDHLVFSGSVEGPSGVRQALSTIRVLDGLLLDVHESKLNLDDQTLPPVIDKWIQFAVNRARAHPWVGATKIALLEKYVFDHVDKVRGTYYDVFGGDTEALAVELNPQTDQRLEEARVLEASKDAIVLEGLDDWPPADIEPPAKKWGAERLEGEGRFTAWIPEWIDLKKHDDRPWPVYRTAIRISKTRRFDPITFVAMDLRQLDLHLVAGIISPRSTTGYRGKGEIPRDPDVLKRVLLAFTGGFKTAHGAYGVQIGGRVFVPHKPAMASLTIYKDRAVRMGTWPGEGRFGNYGEEKRWQQKVGKDRPPEIPADVVDMRQNLAPLVAKGVLNPSGAVRWGGVVDHLTHTSTPRSGVCIRGANTLLFVWCRRCGAADLGQGMIAGGCDYGMHLDMNPYHTGMSMIQIPVEGDKVPREGSEHRIVGANVEKASRQMDFDKSRYIGRDIKDFFYLTWRDNLPRRLGSVPGFGAWSTKGLPVTAAGVEPLAVVGESKEGSVLAFADSFEVAVAEVPKGPPGPGVRGEVQVGIWLDEGSDSGGQTGRVALDTRKNRLSVEGIPSKTAGVETVAQGRTVFLDGAPVSGAPRALGEGAVVVARTLSGDLLFVTCRSAGLEWLNETLIQLDVDAAVLLGRGGINTITFDRDWKQAFSSSQAQPATLELRLVPVKPRARTGVTDFKAPLQSD